MGFLDKLKEAVTGEESDNLGPDRGTMDQREARIERARQEARKEAEKELRQQEVQQAREQAKEEVLNGDDDGDEMDGFLNENPAVGADAALDAMFSTDFDNDGEAFGGEIGLTTEEETEARIAEENKAFANISEQVQLNTQDIQELKGGQQDSSGTPGFVQDEDVFVDPFQEG